MGLFTVFRGPGVTPFIHEQSSSRPVTVASGDDPATREICQQGPLAKPAASPTKLLLSASGVNPGKPGPLYLVLFRYPIPHPVFRNSSGYPRGMLIIRQCHSEWLRNRFDDYSPGQGNVYLSNGITNPHSTTCGCCHSPTPSGGVELVIRALQSRRIVKRARGDSRHLGVRRYRIDRNMNRA